MTLVAKRTLALALSQTKVNVISLQHFAKPETNSRRFHGIFARYQRATCNLQMKNWLEKQLASTESLSTVRLLSSVEERKGGQPPARANFSDYYSATFPM